VEVKIQKAPAGNAAGKSLEGWVVFIAPQDDSKLLMAYDPASGGGMSRGKIVWFQL
jgi:hypothetical protein